MNGKRSAILLAIVCLGLGAWLVHQWSLYRAGAHDLQQQVAPVAAGTGTGGQGIKPPQPPPMPPLASYSEVIERPLFTSTRRPPPEPEKPTAVVTQVPTDYRLEGTALSPRGRVAVVRNTRNSELHRLLEGDQVDGWQVEAVRPGQAALMQGARKLELELDRPSNTPVR